MENEVYIIQYILLNVQLY